MSHKKLREAKNCLNCGHDVEDRFCSHCGQENLELNETVPHLVLHYFQDLFHYDGKLWHTLKNLLTRPGLVAVEYLEGKRQSHLEPIRFYVFTSTVFFLFFFFVIGDDTYTSGVTPATNYSKRLYNLKQEKSFLVGTADTIPANQLIQTVQRLNGDKPIIEIDSTRNDVKIQLLDSTTDTIEPQGWILDMLDHRLAEMEAQHEGDNTAAMQNFLNEIAHTLPQLFFLSLPFFALFLKLLYWRTMRKKYIEHFIFSIYHYAYLFVIMLFYILMMWTEVRVVGTWLEMIVGGVSLILFFYPFVYLFLSMKRFYNDKWTKLIFRYVALSVLLFITILILFILLMIVTFLF